MNGCTLHRAGAGGGSMAKVHLACELYTLPHMSKCEVENDHNHFFAPILMGLKNDIPFCGDVVLLGDGVEEAMFFFNVPLGPEEPPCPLVPMHHWCLLKVDHMLCMCMVLPRGSLVVTFKQAGWILRRDDRVGWMQWVTMGHGLHLAPVSAEQVVE